MALSPSRLVNVSVTLSPTAVVGRTFGELLICGDSNVINPVERFRDFASLEEVTADFGTTAPETLAAQFYFGQSPKPTSLKIARWLRTASSAQNLGQILSASQQALTNFTSITSGGFTIVIDGVTKNLTALDFSAQANLNGVAAVIDTALTGATVAWSGSEFIVTSSTTGAGVRASGTITLTANPAAGNTVTIGGTAVTFVASSPTGNQVLLGVTAAATAVNLQAFLAASADVNISAATYSTLGTVTTVTYGSIGTGGNSFTLAKVGANISLSGATLSGGVAASSVGYATSPGSGTDISALVGLTTATSLALIPGFDAEEPVECVADMANLSSDWYGLMFAAATQPTDDQNIEVANFVEGLSITRVFGVTITNTNVLSSLVTTDLASRMKAAAYVQSLCQYSSQSPYVVASFFGRAFTVNFLAENTTITMMYKQEPLVTAEDLTETQANVLEDKRCNVFTAYVNDTSIIQYGVMSGLRWFDETFGLNWFQDAVQTAVYNALYTSPTKIPQTDAGVNTLTTIVAGTCEQAVSNGLVAPGVWNAAGFGSLTQGQYLKTGYYIFAASVALQAQADRDARKSPPIQIALKLAGAIQTVDVLVSVNR